MIDRIPADGKAGRMHIVPENGDPSFYAKVTMADEPTVPGTPLNKATLLSAKTEKVMGLKDKNTVSDALLTLMNCSMRDLRTFCVHFRGNKTSSGSPFDAQTIFKWTVPSGILNNQVIALVFGGGGGGGLSKTTSAGINGAGGGGSGGMNMQVLTLTPGEVLECHVGRGGKGATATTSAESGVSSYIAKKKGMYGKGGQAGGNATENEGGKGGDGGSGGGGGFSWKNPQLHGDGGSAYPNYDEHFEGGYGGGGGSAGVGGNGGDYGGGGSGNYGKFSGTPGKYSGVLLENFPTYLFGVTTSDCQCDRHYATPGYGGSSGYGGVAGGGGFGSRGGTDTGAGGGGGGGFFSDGHDGVSTSGGGGGGYLDKYAYGGDGSGKGQVGQAGGDGIIVFIYAMSREQPTIPPALV